GRLDAVELRDPLDLARGERELRGRHEVVAREVRARLSEIPQAEPAAAVLLLQLIALLLGQLREPAVVGRREVDGARHGHVRADAREWLEDLRLCLVETRGQRIDRHDETDSEAEAERGEDRPPASPAELREDVGEEEHG